MFFKIFFGLWSILLDANHPEIICGHDFFASISKSEVTCKIIFLRDTVHLGKHVLFISQTSASWTIESLVILQHFSFMQMLSAHWDSCWFPYWMEWHKLCHWDFLEINLSTCWVLERIRHNTTYKLSLYPTIHFISKQSLHIFLLFWQNFIKQANHSWKENFDIEVLSTIYV